MTQLDTLDQSPQRFGLAEESGHRNYSIHRLIIGDYLAIYTIDEEEFVVKVIGFRHGRQLPRPEQLPKSPTESKDR